VCVAAVGTYLCLPYNTGIKKVRQLISACFQLFRFPHLQLFIQPAL
jgi:hypothetical protein